MDSFTEVSRQGWLSRIGGSIKGVLVGLVLFAVAFPVLWWNEGRAVQTYKSLTEGRGAVVSVSSASLAAANDNQLVHVSGLATTTETLRDATFGIAVEALRLIRDVEMYQWTEDVDSDTKKKVGGGTETTKTYTYRKEWADSLVSSADFQQPDDHRNPTSMPYSSDSWSAQVVTVGAFRLSDRLQGQIGGAERLPVSGASGTPAGLEASPATSGGSNVEAAPGRGLRVHDEGYYRGADPDQPQVGDVRVQFSVVRPQQVSIVARQVDGGLSGYQTAAGDVLEMLTAGLVPADQMFTAAEQSNKVLTWFLRVLGFALMAIGMSLVFRPLVVVADVIPFVGDIVGMGTGFIAMVIAAPLSLLTVGVAWMFYRPLLGVVLIAAAVAIVVGIKSLAMKRARAA